MKPIAIFAAISKRKQMKRTLVAVIILTVLAVLPALAQQQKQQAFATKHARMDRSRINVGVYMLQGNARDEAHIKDVADCGIDFVMYMNNDTAALNLFQKYGIGAINVGTVPLWWGGFGDNAGTMSTVNPMSVYEEGAAKFADHPAIWGISICDEPSCLDFDYLGELVNRLEVLFPNQFIHINLHPIYAPGPREGNDPAKGALGTASYQDYIDRYCENVPTDYISYDFYYQNGGVQQDYANMRIVSNACRSTGRSMWVTVQVNSSKQEEWISLNQLRFQAYAALAYGAENITWACYSWGWWYNQVLWGNGDKTQQYDKLQQVNRELHALSPNYMKYKNDSTFCIGFKGTTMLLGSGMETSPVYSDGHITDLVAPGCPLLVGKMSRRDGRRGRALFLCPASDPYDVAPERLRHTLRFRARCGKIKISDGSGPIEVKRLKGGWYEVPIAANQGILIESSR